MDANGKNQPHVTIGAVEMDMIRDLQQRVAGLEAAVTEGLSQIPTVIREAVTSSAADLAERSGLDHSDGLPAAGLE